MNEIIPSFNQAWETDIQDLSDRLLLLEVYQTKRNLIFTGVPEKDGEDTENEIRDIFQDKLDIPLEKHEKISFYAVHRLSNRRRYPSME